MNFLRRVKKSPRSTPSDPAVSGSRETHTHEEYSPPPGPPPSHSSELPPAYSADSIPSPPPPPSQPPPPQHDWQTAVPDTSLLPPPPAIGNFLSSANNASEDEAAQGEEWCDAHPLYAPGVLSPAQIADVRAGRIDLTAPPSFRGTLHSLGTGRWQVSTPKRSGDMCFLTNLPLYAPVMLQQQQQEQKEQKQQRVTAYFEVRIGVLAGEEVGLALGYVAPPYPAFRLPGWHRGSLGVHGDDGSRFVNDIWGGKTFVQPFRAGEVVGLGMDIRRGQGDDAIAVEIFFTRNGREEGRWNLHEESDAEQDLPVTGLEGHHDLVAAVGAFGETGFEVVFERERWVYRES